MSFRNVEFFIKEAMLGLSRNGLMTLVTIGTIVISLVIYGFFILGMYNFYSVFNSMQTKLEIMVYIDDGLDYVTTEKLKTKVISINGVKSVDFISKEEAWENFKVKFGRQMSLISNKTINPLPNAFKVKVIAVEYIDNVAGYLKTVDGVEDVRYGYSVAKRLKEMLAGLQIGSAIVVVLLGMATLFIIVNTIRLTVIARQNEIIIMHLVGATDQFIRWPFIIEGIFLGVIGSIFASIIIFISYKVVVTKIAANFPFLVFVSSGSVLTYIYLSVIVGGTFLGMIGGAISVSRSIRKTYRLNR